MQSNQPQRSASRRLRTVRRISLLHVNMTVVLLFTLFIIGAAQSF